jgi:hypothetical protein
MKTDYNAQAKKFLVDTNTSIYIDKAVPQTEPLWAKKGEKHGIDYSIRLKNSRHCYDFHFWDSIENAEKKPFSKKPTEYDVLSCLNPLQENDFDEFCNAFGYDNDSRQAEKIFNACVEQDRNLRKLWSIDELLLLREIQ